MSKKLGIITSLILMTSLFAGGCSSSSSNIDSLKVLENENARIAINYAVDKDILAKELLKNGSVGTDLIVPKGLATDENGSDYRDVSQTTGYDYNEEKAKEHWDKAKEEVGFDTVTMGILTNDDDVGKITAEFIQSELQKNLDGLTIDIKALPSKQKIDGQINHEYELSNSLWSADFPDPLDFLGVFLTDGFFGNRMQYDDEEYNKLVEKAKNADTTEEAWDIFQQAEQHLLDTGVIVPLYQRGKVFLKKDTVKDVCMYGYGINTSYRYASMSDGSKDLRTTIIADIPTLDISKATDSTSFLVLGNVLEGLTTFDKDGNLKNAIAKECIQSEDGKTWTFKLRTDAKWSNGETITANDFEYSWKRTLNPDTASQYGYLFNDIVGAEDYSTGKVGNADKVGIIAVDDYTLEVKLNRRVNYFDKLMVFPVFYPQSEKFVKEHEKTYGSTEKDILYNGPFTLSNWKMEDNFTLSKNQNYVDKDSIKLENIYYKVSKEANTTVNLYESGQVDMVEITSEFVDKYENSKDLLNVQEPAVSFIMMNVGGSKK